MIDSATERRKLAERLKEARLKAGFTTAAEAARNFGWREVTYTSHENATRGIRPGAAKKYAKAFAIDAGDLLGLQTGRRVAPTDWVAVAGTAAWGVWRDPRVGGSQVQTEAREMPIPNRQRGGQLVRRFLQVGDRSIDRKVPEGEWVVYVEIVPNGVALVEPGRLVVVRRRRNALEEISIRHVESNDGGQLRLTAYSTDRRFQEVLVLPSQDAEVIGLVVGRYGDL